MIVILILFRINKLNLLHRNRRVFIIEFCTTKYPNPWEMKSNQSIVYVNFFVIRTLAMFINFGTPCINYIKKNLLDGDV